MKSNVNKYPFRHFGKNVEKRPLSWSRLSDLMKYLGCVWMDIRGSSCWRILLKPVEIIQFWLKSEPSTVAARSMA
jgi:hypothetical protein